MKNVLELNEPSARIFFMLTISCAAIFLLGADLAMASDRKILRDGTQSRTFTGGGVLHKLPIVAVPLTKKECTGLGGKVTSTNKCSKEGQETCSTVDKDGVVRVACIDEVVKSDGLNP